MNLVHYYYQNLNGIYESFFYPDQTFLKQQKTAFAALQALQSIPRHKIASEESAPKRATYMQSLANLYNTSFSQQAAAFNNDLLIQFALSIANHNGFSAHPNMRKALLPLSQRHVEKLTSLETEILRAYPIKERCKAALHQFVESHEQFSIIFNQTIQPLLKDLPYEYKYKTYPKTVALLEKTYQLALQENKEIKSQLEESDYGVFQAVTDLAILWLITSKEEIPEAFISYKEKIFALRDKSPINTERVKEKILKDIDLEQGSPALEMYKEIGELRTHFQRSKPKIYSTLMQTLQLPCT